MHKPRHNFLVHWCKQMGHVQPFVRFFSSPSIESRALRRNPASWERLHCDASESAVVPILSPTPLWWSGRTPHWAIQLLKAIFTDQMIKWYPKRRIFALLWWFPYPGLLFPFGPSRRPSPFAVPPIFFDMRQAQKEVPFSCASGSANSQCQCKLQTTLSVGSRQVDLPRGIVNSAKQVKM